MKRLSAAFIRPVYAGAAIQAQEMANRKHYAPIAEFST
jgi:hypothetical protein